ncbi:glutathione S-transferase domain-containing protein [Salpingoeca rosetta]|uniref:Glutathione S-transferase domain-containing protein n=1 Tax=Salpingoeca rosetta (strain ATCC 50818 / BSB-021) TaxID=946362 RepID=F2UAH7_SALR5|nr:glutathione S-transferase domain-containing protein [Salpingoeca rosetta]EGD73393.1 glutathione S-transferase domain-containing protein [Salpingoeca rosetta]|eukprot:XP_004993675.1 glutathione S-transferase domain-containing protein [Salpingoeca rosetta]
MTILAYSSLSRVAQLFTGHRAATTLQRACALSSSLSTTAAVSRTFASMPNKPTEGGVYCGVDANAKPSQFNADQDKFAVSAEAAKKGAFKRPATAFHGRVTADGSSEFPAEKGRYHLYVAWACPWAHRALLVHKLKGLEDAISVTVLDWFLDFGNGDDRPYRGWPFRKEDPDPLHPEFTHLHDVYRLADKDYPHKSISVPVLFDKKQQTIVNNESAEIIEILNTEFNAFARNPDLDLNPSDLDQAQRDINALVYPNINDGVYRCGFAGSQEAYDEAVTNLFDTLDKLEAILDKQRYLCGDRLTLADIRLLPTLLRFDIVYHTHFKCNKRRIKDYPNLFAFACELYQLPGVKDTFNPTETKKHYFGSHLKINPLGIVAVGPPIEFDSKHDRAERFPVSSDQRQ